MYLIAKPRKQDINIKVGVTRERGGQAATSGTEEGTPQLRIFMGMLFF